jgi:hypothetical protein
MFRTWTTSGFIFREAAMHQAVLPFDVHAPPAEGHTATWLSMRPDLATITPSGGGFAKFYSVQGAQNQSLSAHSSQSSHFMRYTCES